MLLKHSVLYQTLFPNQQGSEQTSANDADLFALRRMVRYAVAPQTRLQEQPLVIFDTETTGLDVDLDQIIEFGAMKIVGNQVVDEFWSFVSTNIELNTNIINLTKISQDMLEGAPSMQEVLPKFLDFIKGSIIVAHNADFDMGMLKSAGNRLGLDIHWPSFCTVKLARKTLPGLPNYKLDTLAEHFKLSFEARHRAVGDVKVLVKVLQEILENEELGIETWADVKDCSVE